MKIVEDAMAGASLGGTLLGALEILLLGPVGGGAIAAVGTIGGAGLGILGGMLESEEEIKERALQEYLQQQKNEMGIFGSLFW